MKHYNVGDVITDTASFGTVQVIARYVHELAKHVTPETLQDNLFVYDVRCLENNECFLARDRDLDPMP